MKKLLILLFSIAILAGCGNKNGQPGQENEDQKAENTIRKKSSSGKTLELLLVADRNVYAGDTKDRIKELFAHPQETFMTVEPIFDIVNIPYSSFQNTEMFRVHRNVIICNIGSENQNKVYRSEDQYAAPQIVYEFSVKNLKALDSLMTKYASKVIEDMYTQEHRRIIKAFNGMRNTKLMQELKKNFDFTLTLSDEFEIAKMNDEFAWIRKEAKDFSIGVLVQVMPYTDKKQFDEAVVLNSLDSTMKKYVPGPAEGSYMGTERRWEFTHKQTKVSGQFAMETRGMFRTFGDYLGGPFVNYTVITPDNKTLVQLTAYTFSPRNTNQMPYAKRDHLMQVESICHSIKF